MVDSDLENTAPTPGSHPENSFRFVPPPWNGASAIDRWVKIAEVIVTFVNLMHPGGTKPTYADFALPETELLTAFWRLQLNINKQAVGVDYRDYLPSLSVYVKFHRRGRVSRP